jgi:amino-acid N-acetyltransferase
MIHSTRTLACCVASLLLPTIAAFPSRLLRRQRLFTTEVFSFGSKTTLLKVSKDHLQEEEMTAFNGEPTTTPTFTEATEKEFMGSVLAIDPSEVKIVTLSEDQDKDKNEKLALDLSTLPFVSMFRGSANYIANHRNTMAVLHIPGDLLDLPDKDVFRDLMNDVALTWLLGVKLVLVVGCRYQIEQRVGESQRSHGLRVTDSDTLRIVKEEAGCVRFEVERQLARSLRMQGGSGESTNKRSAASPSQGYFDANVLSGNFYSAQPFGVLDGVDYQYTGFVRRVEVDKIKQALNMRDICLLTTLGVSPSGEVFNVNSESLAASVAGALGASKVLYFTEKDMELRHGPSGTKIQHMRMSDARNLLNYTDVTVNKKGYVNFKNLQEMDRNTLNMFLKIGFSINALEQGVKRAHVISPKHGALLQELYTRDGSGMMISGDLYEGIRQADVTDVASVYDLIYPLIQAGTLIDRPRAQLEKDIDTYYVFTRDNLIVACGQLKIYEDGFAEIGCLVVNPEYRSRGRGDAMLGYLERMCVIKKCTNVFVLSTQTMEWFLERQFESVDVDRLPPSRQKTYNYERRSKIYMKKIKGMRDLDASELWWNR